MSVTAEDFLALAVRLTSATSETEWRSGVSRGYYACFHLARETSASFPDNTHFDIKGGTHARLIEKFQTYRPFSTPEGKKARQIAYVLATLKKRREKADYDIPLNLTQDEAKTAIDMVRQLQAHIKKLTAMVKQTETA